MKPIQLVLFDLDGTLLDTAPDMAYALNQLRHKHGLTELPLETIRPHVGIGSSALLQVGLNINDNHPDYTNILKEYLDLYHHHLNDSSALFPGMETVLQTLESKHIPWGIVTNKPSRFTFDLLKRLNLYQRAGCVICGDSLSKRKPDPEPILHACALLKHKPENCLYVGDTETDVKASKAAGVRSLILLYGYIAKEEDPYAWNADIYEANALGILKWV